MMSGSGNAQGELIALAGAVSAPGASAMQLGADNKSLPGSISIDEAVASGLPFIVPLASHLSAIDVDGPEILTKVRRMVEDGIVPIVRVGSGRVDHEHWYFQVPENVEPRHWPHVEKYGIESGQRLWGGGKSIRPPLSPHRQALQPHLIEPETAGEVIALLSAGASFEPERPRVYGTMSDATRQMLIEGDVTGVYTYVDADGVLATKRSALFMALAHSFIRDGLSIDDFIAAAQVRTNKGCQKAHAIAQSTGPVAALKYTRETYEKALKWRSAHPERTISNGDEAVSYLLAAKHAVTQYRGFKPRTEVTERGVMLALIEAGLGVHKPGVVGATIVPAPGIRRLSDVSGFAKTTVRLSLKRLVAEGWLTQLDRANGLQWAVGRNDPTRYRINIKASVSAPSLGLLPGAIHVDGENNTHSSPILPARWHEAFHRNALGQSARETYAACLAAGTWTTVLELSERTGKKVATVRAHLRKLKDPQLPVRLVETSGQSHQAHEVSEADLVAIAEHFGTSGSHAKRANLHQQEREAQQLFSQIRGMPHHGRGIVADVQPTTDTVPGNTPAYCPPWTRT